MTKKMTVAEKITKLAVRKTGLDPEKNYLDLINAVDDKTAFAVTVTMLDKVVSKQSFNDWVKQGFSHSKRSMRVFHKIVPELGSDAANNVLGAKKDFIYSVCKKQDELSKQAYLHNRKGFLAAANNFLQTA